MGLNELARQLSATRDRIVGVNEKIAGKETGEILDGVVAVLSRVIDVLEAEPQPGVPTVNLIEEPPAGLVLPQWKAILLVFMMLIFSYFLLVGVVIDPWPALLSAVGMGGFLTVIFGVWAVYDRQRRGD